MSCHVMSCPHLSQDVGQLLDLQLARPLEVLGGEGELDLPGLLAQVRGQLQRVDLARAVAHWGYTLHVTTCLSRVTDIYQL